MKIITEYWWNDTERVEPNCQVQSKPKLHLKIYLLLQNAQYICITKPVPYCCLRKYLLSIARVTINLINEICEQNAATCNSEAFCYVWQTFCREG
jgi:hypothetical protein